jgi:hypothetical protein
MVQALGGIESLAAADESGVSQQVEHTVWIAEPAGIDPS